MAYTHVTTIVISMPPGGAKIHLFFTPGAILYSSFVDPGLAPGSSSSLKSMKIITDLSTHVRKAFLLSVTHPDFCPIV